MILEQYINNIAQRYILGQGQQGNKERNHKIPDLAPAIIDKIAKGMGLTFISERETEGNVCFVNSPELRDDYKTAFTAIDLLDYGYAMSFRKQQKEDVKIDFRQMPYPKAPEAFWRLVQLGRELRQIHCLQSPKVEKYITSYPKDGSHIITRKLTKTDIPYEAINDTHGRVWINDGQYFGNVPLTAWEFYIGKYQPAQQWLKDRRGKTLAFEDILHYQKIIVALTETDRLTKEIDNVKIE
ncbi:type ISP restriction/modification enzyme [Pseudozobellia thermophila]|uniref:Type ISP restriction-modification enzyme LLaBIII C-terminal specificity domain-containing protein n=1 Tax=Pseudozobellia thermophila TaxID=192903 RepID=A0A1M6I4T6_9FLAO|nr:type ISP restriction/modification enzyme [Pseudozobellia thermophila]SHJ29453.1 hypothetical protein SAMN04488513_103328 [Pseudozobellia thermophila]